MRLMILTALYPPAVGGVASYFGVLAPNLARRREIDELTVLTENMSGQPPQWASGNLRLLRLLPPRVSSPPRHWLDRLATYAATQLWFAVRLPSLVRRYRIDLIQFHTRFRGRLFHAALRRCAVPVLADMRDKMTDPSRLANVADRLLCCSKGVQRFAIQGAFPADQTVLIPYLFDPPEIPSAQQVSDTCLRYGLGREPYLIFVGDITYKKGVYDLIEAYRRWQLKCDHVRLVMVGNNREGARFLREVRRADGATYLGPVSHSEALALIRGAKIMILPSRSEGLPRVILEAVALGTKVICPPEIPEFGRHLPDFVLPRVHPDSIVEMLSTIWGHKAPPPSFPFSGYSVGHVVEALTSVYAEVLR